MRRALLILGGVLLVALCAAGAYMAGRLIKVAPPNGREPWDVQRAGELPAGPADVIGFVTQRGDSSLFIGTAQLSVAISQEDPTDVRTGYNGPVVEVVANRNTTIYRNATERPTPPAAGQTAQIQQAVVPGWLDGIGTNTILTVWGSRSGDRIVARVLLYSDPTLIKAVH